MRKTNPVLIILSATVAVIVLTVSCVMCVPSSLFTWTDAFRLIGVNISPTESDTVYFLSVGHGDCTVVVSDGKVALIDSGTTESCHSVRKFLSGIGCSRIECLFVTHPHTDHIGGAAGLSDFAEIKKVVVPDWIPAEDARVVSSILNKLKVNKVAVDLPKVGTSYKMGNAVFDIIHYDPDAYEENDRCAVIKLTMGESTFLFTGDICSDCEDRLVSNGCIGKCTVLKAGHHGSKDSTGEQLLIATDPKYVIFSCGLYNIYGHPDDETINRVKQHGATYFRTDTDGTVTVDVKSMKFTTEY